jgi:signal transduction histidine kinase
MARRTLRARIALGLLGYTLLLSMMVFAFGEITDDDEDIAIEQSLLSHELDDFVRHRALDSHYPLPSSGKLHTYLGKPADGLAGVPAGLRSLQPGLHNDIEVDGLDLVALVRDLGAERIYVVFDMTQQEREENSMVWWALAFFLLGVSVLAIVIWWLSGKLLRPVTDLASAIDRVTPDEREHRIDVADGSVTEIATIAGAMNRYFKRMDGFVSRERAFIDSVSHELRTPIAVIAGASEVMDADAALPDSSRRPLARIRQTAADVEQLITALLVLAKAPARLRASGESCQLEELVPAIVDAHEHLRRGKTLQMVVGELLPSRMNASAQIVQVAIANILRNAIENTDCGRIDISVRPAGVVRIQDSGRGMSPQEIGKVYAALARRGDGSSGSGIGLQLIRRICEHLGWVLEITHTMDEGTLVVLDMRSSLAHA